MGGLGIANFDFLLTFFNMDISLNSQQKDLNFFLCGVRYHIEGTMSHIFYLCLSLYCMESRTLSLKK